MSRWFRFYDDAINDPKILRLPEATRWHWAALLCIASKNDGKLPAIADIAVMLRKTKAAAAAILAGLVNAGLIDKTEEGDFEPHNWSGRQYKSDVTDPTAADRMMRYRSNKRNNRNASVTQTRPETEQRQITETDSEQSGSARTREAVAPHEEKTKPLIQLQPDWRPDEQDIATAHDAGLTDDEIDAIAKRFGPYYRGRGEFRADWHEQWKSWCLDEGAKKPKLIPDEPAEPVDWDKAIAFFKKTNRWWKGIGPEPLQTGCRAPADLLAKYGYEPLEKSA